MRRFFHEIRVAWRFPKDWNARATEKGYHAALLPTPPLHKRIQRTLHQAWWSGRRGLAHWIYPYDWADE